jgi:diaminopimelate epimerase
VKLAKLHGLGNDFLVIAAGEIGSQEKSASEIARILCERHTGIGADGVIVYQPAIHDADADVSALIYNADGSRAEMSGNGTRCLAAYLMRTGPGKSRICRIRTVAGIKTYTLQHQSGRTGFFESSLGFPITDPALIPVRLAAGASGLVGFPVSIGGDTVKVTVCSMGNPHCSTFWHDVSRAPLERLGPALERHDGFPDRTNVEFIQVLDRHTIRARFWERGVGATLASGTGSAAAAVAAILNGFADSPVTVEVELGELRVAWQPPGGLSLAGPAEYICSIDYPGGQEAS